jgi:hypothetical protein
LADGSVANLERNVQRLLIIFNNMYLTQDKGSTTASLVPIEGGQERAPVSALVFPGNASIFVLLVDKKYERDRIEIVRYK